MWDFGPKTLGFGSKVFGLGLLVFGGVFFFVLVRSIYLAVLGFGFRIDEFLEGGGGEGLDNSVWMAGSGACYTRCREAVWLCLRANSGQDVQQRGRTSNMDRMRLRTPFPAEDKHEAVFQENRAPKIKSSNTYTRAVQKSCWVSVTLPGFYRGTFQDSGIQAQNLLRQPI